MELADDSSIFRNVRVVRSRRRRFPTVAGSVDAIEVLEVQPVTIARLHG
jgi:hypothetical protein